jgi:uncharacterized membrane protein YbhN (UPF0104 family)
MTIRWDHVRVGLGYAAAAALVTWGAVWGVRHGEQIAKAFRLRPAFLALLVPLIVASLVLTGLLNQLVAGALGARLRRRQWLALGFASTLANYVLPLRAGAAMRAAYYKRLRGLPFARFASCMAVAYVITLLVNAAVCAGALAWFGATGERTSWPLFWVAAALALGCITALVFSPSPAEAARGAGLRGFLGRVHEGWDLLRRKPRLMSQVGAVCLGTAGLYAVRLWIAFAAAGNPLSAAGCLLVGSAVGLSMFFSVTPAALGVRELVIVLVSAVVGVPPEVSLMAGALDRAVAILIVMVLGPVATLYLARNLPQGWRGRG